MPKGRRAFCFHIPNIFTFGKTQLSPNIHFRIPSWWSSLRIGAWAYDPVWINKKQKAWHRVLRTQKGQKPKRFRECKKSGAWKSSVPGKSKANASKKKMRERKASARTESICKIILQEKDHLKVRLWNNGTGIMIGWSPISMFITPPFHENMSFILSLPEPTLQLLPKSLQNMSLELT